MDEEQMIDPNDMAQFEWYEGGARGRYSFASCSLSRSGSMTFAPAAVAALGKPEAVRLGWDARRKRIGIAGAAKGQPGAVAMRVLTDAKGDDVGSRSIFAKSFLMHYGILPTENARYRLSEVGPGMLALTLDNPLPRSRRTRTKDVGRPPETDQA